MGSSLELQFFLGFRMAIFLDSLHMVGFLCSMKHLRIITRSFGTDIFSCSTKTSYPPATLLSLVCHYFPVLFFAERL